MKQKNIKNVQLKPTKSLTNLTGFQRRIFKRIVCFSSLRRYAFADQGAVLTTDTDQFIIGQRVYVGGHRPGQIAFIGETNFAPGEWAGIVLDDASGKNDGTVSGKRYFQCEPKRGIFSKLTRLTLEPLGEITCGSPTNSMNTSYRSVYSPPRSGAVSPTRSISSYIGKSPSS